MLQRSFNLVSALVLVMGLTTFTYQNVSAHGPMKLPALSQRKISAESQPAAPPRAAAPSLKREVFGFGLASSLSDPTVGYPSWNFSLLSTVAFFGLHVNWDGTIVADNGWNVWNSGALTGLLTTARASGTRVVVSIILQDFAPGTPNMCAGLINRAITVRQTAAQVAAKGVDGVNVDYEGLNGTCQNGQTAQSMMTDFVRQLRAALPTGSYLSVDTYAGSAADTLGFFDVPGLSAYADSLFVMAYDLEYANYRRAPLGCSTFCLGPTAPLSGYFYNDTSTASQYAAVVPASKVILGVPYYGRKACVAGASPNAYPTSGVVADSYLDASTESTAPEMQAGSYAAHRDANDPSGQERWDTWYNTSLGCTRELYWDDPVSLGAKYDLVNRDGLRGVGIWNLNYGGGARELWSALSNHFATCAAVSVTASPATSASVGQAVTFSASASGCPSPSPLYQFWILVPGASAYRLAQAYSTNATLQWNTSGAGAGTYGISVWVRDANSIGASGNAMGRWDAYASIQYTLASSACSSVTASSAPVSAAPSGTTVTITATASGCGNPLYQFWSLRPGAASYQLVQAYSSNATLRWNTSGAPAGTYNISIWVRDLNSAGIWGNAFGRWDAYDNSVSYTLTPVCTAVSVSVLPASPAAVGTTVTVTAHATGCAKPAYHFEVLAPGASSYQLAQDYSTSPSLTWNTSGLSAGSYRFSIWVRDAGGAGLFGNSFGRWDAYNNDTLYTLTPACSAVSMSVAPVSPAAAGTNVAVTAHATGCGNPLYSFSVLAPGAVVYQLAQDYSTSPSFSWNTAGLAPGTYRFSVWVRDAGSPGIFGNSFGRWDAYSNDTLYTLTAVCSVVSVSVSPASPARPGTAVTVTARASGCPNPVYEFWVLAPGGSSFQLDQGYSGSSTFTWNTSGLAPGSYRFSVWARDAGSSGIFGNSFGRWDAYNNDTQYTLG